jgi:hypothetical protein
MRFAMRFSFGGKSRHVLRDFLPASRNPHFFWFADSLCYRQV